MLLPFHNRFTATNQCNVIYKIILITMPVYGKGTAENLEKRVSTKITIKVLTVLLKTAVQL
jgi:hypothetical protein